MFVLLVSAALAECTPGGLEPSLEAAEAAYLARDVGTLKEHLHQAEHVAECAHPSPRLAARLLRARGLLRAVRSDWEGVHDLFRASVAAHPLLPFPEPLQADQRLHLEWQRAQESPIHWTTAEPALVNGAVSSLRPDAIVLGERPPPRPARTARITALGLGAASVATYAGAWAARADYQRFTSDPGELDALRRQRNVVNGLAIGSFTTGVFAVGLLGASFTL